FLILDIANDGLRDAQSTLQAYELEPMHHFSVNTAGTLALRDNVRQVWKIVIPQECYRYLFIMDCLIAVSALHKSLLIPSRREEYMNVAACHQPLAMKVFAARLDHVNETNWDSSLLELFAVTRGMRSFLQPFLKDLCRTSSAPLHHGIRTPLGNRPYHNVTNHSTQHILLPRPGVYPARHLGGPRPHVRRARSRPLPGRQDYLDAAASFQVCAELLSKGGMVFIWQYDISERVLLELRALSGPALLLVAHYCVFFPVMEARQWYFCGSAR
ncbi:hypothetical protein ACHAP6_009239, partial [Verticillium nonalfalfae]